MLLKKISLPETLIILYFQVKFCFKTGINVLNSKVAASFIISSNDFIVKSLTFFNKGFVQNGHTFLQLLHL